MRKKGYLFICAFFCFSQMSMAANLSDQQLKVVNSFLLEKLRPAFPDIAGGFISIAEKKGELESFELQLSVLLSSKKSFFHVIFADEVDIKIEVCGEIFIESEVVIEAILLAINAAHEKIDFEKRYELNSTYLRTRQAQSSHAHVVLKCVPIVPDLKIFKEVHAEVVSDLKEQKNQLSFGGTFSKKEPDMQNFLCQANALIYTVCKGRTPDALVTTTFSRLFRAFSYNFADFLPARF